VSKKVEVVTRYRRYWRKPSRVRVRIQRLVLALALGRARQRLDHVLAEGLVGFLPCLLDVGGHVALEVLPQGDEQGFSHDGEHLRLDSVRDVFGSELQHDLGQELNVRTQHVQRSVEHLNQVRGVHQEPLRREQVGRLRVDVDGEPEQHLALRAFREQVLEERGTGDLFVVLDTAELLLLCANDASEGKEDVLENAWHPMTRAKALMRLETTKSTRMRRALLTQLSIT